MITIKLKQAEYQFLIEYSLKDNNKFDLGNNIRDTGRNVYLDLDEDTIEDIRDWAGDKLLEIGFDEDYNLNPKGEILDTLIDRFYIE